MMFKNPLYIFIEPILHNLCFYMTFGASLGVSLISGAVGGACADDPPEPDYTAYTAELGKALSMASSHKTNIGTTLGADISATIDEAQFQGQKLLDTWSGEIEDIDEQGVELLRKSGFDESGMISEHIEETKEAAYSDLGVSYTEVERAQEKEQRGLERQADKDLRMIERDIQKMLTEYAATTESEYGSGPWGGTPYEG